MIGALYPLLLAGNATEPPAAEAPRETLGGRGRHSFDHDTHGATAAVLTIIALLASGELDE